MELKFRKCRIGDVTNQLQKKKADTSIYFEDTIDCSGSTTQDISIADANCEINEKEDLAVLNAK